MFSISNESAGIIIILTVIYGCAASQLRFYQEHRPDELDIICRFVAHPSSRLSNLDGLVIARQNAGSRSVLASVSPRCDQNSPLSRVPEAKVSGHLSYNISTPQYLRIVWRDPQSSLDGNYTCEAYAVDIDFIPQSFSQQITVKTERPGLQMVAIPSVITTNITQKLQIVCTLPDHSAVNIIKVASLEIFKQQNGIKCQFARIKLESGQAVLTGAFKASLNGTMDENRTVLELSWGNITNADAGEFICEGSGVNAQGHPVFFSKHLYLNWTHPKREELVKILFEMYDKELEHLKIQEEKKQMLKGTNQMINELRNTQCRKPNSCDSALFELGQRVVYVEPDDGLGPIPVVCEGREPREMWTVIQKRFDGSVDFYRNFSDYENGFGDLDGEFWLGLKNIRRLLIQNEDKNKLRIEITEMNSGKNFTKNYHSFSIGQANGYRLYVTGFDDLGYGMSYNSGFNFSTFDSGVLRLAELNRGGWWYNFDSPYVNLNGVWGIKGKRYSVYWSEFRRDRNVILERTEMMFKKNY